MYVHFKILTMSTLETILEVLIFASQAVGNSAIKDIYEQLKEHIQKKLIDTNIAKRVSPDQLLEAYEQQPDTWKEVLKSALDEAKIYQDREILEKTFDLSGLMKSTQTTKKSQSFHNHGSGTQNNIGNKVINNQNTYNQTYSEPSEYFDEIEDKNGMRIRTTYKRDSTGMITLVGQQLT